MSLTYSCVRVRLYPHIRSIAAFVRAFIAIAFIVCAGQQAAQSAPELISQANTTRAVALESVTRLREPFPPNQLISFGADSRTRIMLFAKNLDLLPGENASSVTVEAENGARVRYPLTVEHVGKVAGFEWLSMLIVRLHDELGDVGDVLVGLQLRGMASNRVRIGIGHTGGGPPDDAGPNTPVPDLGAGASLHGKRVFPADNPWNEDISGLPVDPNSNNLIASIGLNTGLHPDFGTVWAGAPNGIPYIIVSGTQQKVTINFTDYADESDPGPYPVPPNAPIEGGPNGTGDRHVIVIDRDNWKLYELFSAFPAGGGTS